MSTTPSGIELSTFRLTVRCLNQLSNRVPTGVFHVYQNSCSQNIL